MARDGSPIVQFRLPARELRALTKIAKLCGRPSAAILCRDLIRAGISEEPLKVLNEIAQALTSERQRQLEFTLHTGKTGGSLRFKAKGRRG